MLEGLLAAGAGVMIFSLLLIVFLIICRWKIFAKAGQPGWASIVPIYNTIVYLQVCKKPVWWIVLLLLPFVNIVILIILTFQLAKVFGKGAGFGVGLLLVPIICLPILAFGSAQYVTDESASAGEE